MEQHKFETYIPMEYFAGRDELLARVKSCFQLLKLYGDRERIELINDIRAELHELSPFKNEPIDFVRWVPNESVASNDYNPNKVAPPEMELLAHSIISDGYTQPIVGWNLGETYEVIDGFHRNRVGKENAMVNQRVQGFLPIVQIKSERTDKKDRIASTIRHNRARGKHQIDAMSDIVVELKHRNWSNERIARELGMDQDEVLRLCQITGLSNLFSDTEFSQAWEVEGFTASEDIDLMEESEEFRKVPSGGDDRIFHTYESWECYKAGFYATTHPSMSKKECEQGYRDFLSDLSAFDEALEKVCAEWKNSCEHYLTNGSMNRIAWLGQAALCYAKGIPAIYRGGFSLLTELEQQAANEMALKHLNKWLIANGREEISMDAAYGGQSDLY